MTGMQLLLLFCRKEVMLLTPASKPLSSQVGKLYLPKRLSGRWQRAGYIGLLATHCDILTTVQQDSPDYHRICHKMLLIVKN